MKVTYSWLTFSCLIFGFGILCDENPDRRQAGSSCSVTSIEELFRCSDGLCIAWSSVCDGRNDCLDNSDENKELCARYEYGTNNTRECGRVYNTSHSALSINGKKELVGTAPWNVAIYLLKNTSTYEYICGGSIIDPKIIVSAARCFFYSRTSNNTIFRDVNSFKVVVGKYDTHFTVADNKFTQRISVEHIYLNVDISKESEFFNKNIAVIVLSTRIIFNNFVSPVCIDWSGKYNVENGDRGKVVGHRITEKGGNGTILLEKLFVYIDLTNCRNTFESEITNVTNDLFCAGFVLVPGETLEGGTYGSGSTFLYSGSYYLTGVLSYKYIYLSDRYSLEAFTDIKRNKWIHSLIKKLDSKLCVLPAVEGVVYTDKSSNEILAHGAIINQYTAVIENCDVGYHKAYPIGFRVCQGNGKWISTSEKLCYKMCPPLLSDSLDIECTLNGKFANCSNPSIAETIAILSCKPVYTAPFGLENTPSELICQSNGEWNKQLYKCNPRCGKVYSAGKTLITNDTKTLVGTAPWNVGIYRLIKDKINYELKCGGSIIAPNLVVSAANCFWYKGILSKKISINYDSYKVAIGKYDRNISVIDNTFTKIMNVENIYIYKDYFGIKKYFAHDVAIIVLSKNISFSYFVAPICIDWDKTNIVSNGVEGKFVGWGKTENGTLSPVLLETSLPYIDHNSCLDMYTDGFKIFLTVDKFCAGSALVSGRAMSDANHGAGLTFYNSTSYYLTGVFSLKKSSSNDSIAVFTDISRHVQWIHEIYNKYS